MQVRLLPGPLRNFLAIRGVDRSPLGGAQASAPGGGENRSNVQRRGHVSRDKLKALEELQKVDLQIRDLAQQAEKHPARLKQIETERNQARAALDAQRGRLADNERARRQNEQL